MLHDEDYVIVGRLGATYGVYGWLKVHSFTDPITNITTYSRWWLHYQKQWQPLICAIKPHGQWILAQIQSCDQLEQAKPYIHCPIAILRQQLVSLDKDEHYWHDLIGLSVINQKQQRLGTLTRIFDTVANDVFVVQGEKEHLIPHVTDIVLDIDLNAKQILVDWDHNF